MPTFQMRKLWPREEKWPGHSPIVSQGWGFHLEEMQLQVGTFHLTLSWDPPGD